MKAVTKANNVFDRVNDLLAVIAGVLICWLMLSITYAVIIRYFWGLSNPWIFEIWEYSLLYITFLGAAWLLRRGGYPSMEVVLTRLKPRAQAVLNIITSLLVTILCLALTWYGAQATWNSFQLGYLIVGVLFPPQGLILMIIPIGSSLLFIQSVKRTYGYFVGWRAIPDKERRLVMDRPLEL